MSKQPISKQAAGPVEGPLSDNERLKRESNFLRGTIAEDLQDPLTGGFNGDNFQLIRFHGMYQQDDRDIRPERTAQKLEPLHNVMLRARLPGGIITPAQWQIIDKFAEELMPVYKLWNMVSDFHNSMNDWLHGDFKELDGKVIDEMVTDWWKTSYKLSKSLEEELPGASACAAQLRAETTEFRKNMPVIQSLASKALKRRHWEALSELLGKIIDPEDELTLQDLLDLDAAANIESIQEITIAAEKEYNLERTMNAMMKEWETIEFEVKAYKESGTFVVGGVDEIITLLDENGNAMTAGPLVIRQAESAHFWGDLHAQTGETQGWQ